MRRGAVLREQVPGNEVLLGLPRLVRAEEDAARRLASIAAGQRPATNPRRFPGGESGRPDSPHDADILPLFEKGEGISLQLDPAAAAEEQILLTPASSALGSRNDHGAGQGM